MMVFVVTSKVMYFSYSKTVSRVEKRSTDTRSIGTTGYYGQFCPQNTPFMVYLKLLIEKIKEKQPTVNVT